jgi:hypothetical protein
MFNFKPLFGLAICFALIGATLSLRASAGLTAMKEAHNVTCGIKVVELDPGYGTGRTEVRYVCDDTP